LAKVSEYNGPNRRRKRNVFARALGQLGHDPPPDARWHHIWRDFVPLFALLIAAYAVFGVEGKVDQATVNATTARQVAASQLEGRKTAVSITCGAISAVIEAGRTSITGGAVPPGRFERNLVRLGYPPEAERKAAAKKAADAYSLSIAKAIERESGVQGIVSETGSLDCDRLRRAARAP
jgi:hypothetical protein